MHCSQSVLLYYSLFIRRSLLMAVSSKQQSPGINNPVLPWPSYLLEGTFLVMCRQICGYSLLEPMYIELGPHLTPPLNSFVFQLFSLVFKSPWWQRFSWNFHSLAFEVYTFLSEKKNQFNDFCYMLSKQTREMWWRSSSHRCPWKIIVSNRRAVYSDLAWQRLLRDRGRQLRHRVVMRGMETYFTL